MPGWLTPVLQNGGRRELVGDAVRLVNGRTTRGRYVNAQLCDYIGLRRRDFPNRPPLRLALEARFSGTAETLRGTAGFGFWNDPFGSMAHSWPTLPRALWFFFASGESNMRLATNVIGYGWKAAALDALSMPAPLFLPAIGIAAPFMTSQAFFRSVWPFFESHLRVCERLLNVDMQRWARYELEWSTDVARFVLDGETLLECAPAPSGPLGLVIWIDNQYMVATPWGTLRHGVLALDNEQWMEIRNLSLDRAGFFV